MKLTIKQDGKQYKVTDAQVHLAEDLKELGFHGVRYEHRFTDERMWRFDLYAYLHRHGRYPPFLFEVDGGKRHGGHARGDEVDDENEKKNIATLQGFTVLTFTNDFVLSGKAKAFLKEYL